MVDKELINLASQVSYLHPSRFISGRIIEYDIKEANISMLYKYGKISLDYYMYLKRLPKRNREVDIGKLIAKDKSYYDTIKNGISEAKIKLFTNNDISLNNVCRIANDAVYINKDYDLYNTSFDSGIIEFKKKSIWSNMITVDKHFIIFLFFDHYTGNTQIDVKGISENAAELHGPYMITFIATLFNILESGSVEYAMEYFGTFFDDYIKLKLPKEYYRELTPESLYHYKNSDFYLMNISDISEIDIGYNLYILRQLWSIVLEQYKIGIGKL